MMEHGGTPPKGVGKPTLLVFTLGPAAEARRRPLLPESLRESDRDLRRACLETILATGRSAGLHVEVCSPEPLEVSASASWSLQHGRTFGERLRNALLSAFARGSGPVLLVGSDTPGLKVAHLEEALRLLAHDPDRVVLGPARDGGFYLLAASRPLDRALEQTHWCGTRTRATLVAALRSDGRPILELEVLSDLDTPRDLEGWLAKDPTGTGALAESALGLARLLRQLRRPGILSPCARRDRLLAGSPFGRGPPIPY
ncbi:MAG TPA: DUF2064 domain-containing protein [Vicinamibacteria bacterium]|jgi:2-phospho-L-lactate guanylyltransferase (CobY/MobA/RfbA family)|nr:DUF2064 domain-containing protein [Vicinamibacteria bacterium]